MIPRRGGIDVGEGVREVPIVVVTRVMGRKGTLGS
jgi:hypothetical protein